MKPSMSSICGAISPPRLISPAFSAVGIKRATGITNERSRFQSRLPGGPEIESYAAVIIASIDATSAGLADGIFDVRGLKFDASARLQRSTLSSVPLHSALSSLHCARECRGLHLRA